jgi:hypothetical protein
MPAMRIALQRLLDNQRQAVETFAHIGMAGREPDATALRDRDHDRRAFKVAAINAVGASALMRTRASFISTVMTPAFSPFSEGVAGGPASMATGAKLAHLLRLASLTSPFVDKARANILASRHLRHDRARRRRRGQYPRPLFQAPTPAPLASRD